MKLNTKKYTARLGCLLICLSALSLSACKQQAKTSAASPITVNIQKVEPKNVPLYLNFIGLTEAIEAVDVRARVEGFLFTQDFDDGAYVKKNQLLFTIDPREYKAALVQAEATLQQDKANAVYQAKELARMKKLSKDGFVAKEQYDLVFDRSRSANAAVASALAGVIKAKLNLNYTTMKSPIDGLAGEGIIDVGNLVGDDEATTLVTIVQLNPMYVLFYPSTEDLALMGKYLDNFKSLPVAVSSPHKKQSLYKGKIDFVNNQIDKQTSTLKMRGLIENPKHKLLPNIYVNVRVFVTTIKDALSVPTKALISGQAATYVYIVGKNNTVEKKSVTTGNVVGKETIITKGISAGDQVITDNLQQLKPSSMIKIE